MNDQNGDSGEVLRTLGLMLNLSAIVAFALFLSTLGPGEPGPSALAAAIAVISFLASLLCFAIDRRRTEDDTFAPDALPASAVAEV